MVPRSPRQRPKQPARKFIPMSKLPKSTHDSFQEVYGSRKSRDAGIILHLSKPTRVSLNTENRVPEYTNRVGSALLEYFRDTHPTEFRDHEKLVRAIFAYDHLYVPQRRLFGKKSNGGLTATNTPRRKVGSVELGRLRISTTPLREEIIRAIIGKDSDSVERLREWEGVLGQGIKSTRPLRDQMIKIRYSEHFNRVVDGHFGQPSYAKKKKKK